jgi:hypothetical protein
MLGMAKMPAKERDFLISTYADDTQKKVYERFKKGEQITVEQIRTELDKEKRKKKAKAEKEARETELEKLR